MPKFELLPGLPAYGSPALQFSETGLGKHSEGFVVRFIPDNGPSWVGNFQPGLSNFSTVVGHPDPRFIIVVSGGQGYIVNPELQSTITTFGGQISFLTDLSEPQGILFHNGLWFEALGPNGILWKSRRISWDGIRNVQISGLLLSGEA